MKAQVNEDDRLKKEFEEACKDPSFKYVMGLVEASEEELMKRTARLKTSAQELKNCKTCKSLMACKNRVKGCVLMPKTIGKRVDFSYVACKKKIQELDNEKNSCEYYDMPASLKSLSMKDIIADDKARVDIIKFLVKFYDSFLDDPHQKGLYLYGSFGSGKTFLICAMLNELAKRKVDICVAYYPELLRSLKESFETDFPSRMDKLKKVSVLFLDDIGAESVTPWGRDEVLGTILQYRMDEKLPTFFTSNLTIEELEENLSATKMGVDKVKARRIIERIKVVSQEMVLISKDRRK